MGFGETKLEGHSYSWVEMGEGAVTPSGEAKFRYRTILSPLPLYFLLLRRAARPLGLRGSL